MRDTQSAPTMGALLKAELDILWIRGRRSVLIYLGLLYGLLFVVTMATNQQLHVQPGSATDTFIFAGPGIAVVPFLLGVLWALWSWRGEPPSRRGYFFAAPVDRTAHALVRLAAGWLWLMGCIAAYVLGVAVAVLATSHLGADALLRGPYWGWIGVFVSASVVYLLTAPFALLSERPDTAVVLTMVVVLFMGPLLHLVGAVWLLEQYTRVLAHLLRATFGSSPTEAMTGPAAFFAAAAIWVAVGAAATTAAARRYFETR
jgi:hypothetical protein